MIIDMIPQICKYLNNIDILNLTSINKHFLNSRNIIFIYIYMKKYNFYTVNDYINSIIEYNLLKDIYKIHKIKNFKLILTNVSNINLLPIDINAYKIHFSSEFDDFIENLPKNTYSLTFNGKYNKKINLNKSNIKKILFKNNCVFHDCIYNNCFNLNNNIIKIKIKYVWCYICILLNYTHNKFLLKI